MVRILDDFDLEITVEVHLDEEDIAFGRVDTAVRVPAVESAVNSFYGSFHSMTTCFV